MKKLNNVEILLSDARGIFIPRDFFEGFDLDLWNLGNYDLKALSDPENENYWDTWEIVLNNAHFNIEGKVYTLYQDGDLFAICYDEMTDIEKENFGFEI